MTRTHLTMAIVAGALAVLFACSNSGSSGGEICDNGGGGLTAAICANYAAEGSCTSQSFATTPAHPCTQFPNQTITTDCCKINDCTGNTSFLKTQSTSEFPPGPVCGAEDGGVGD